jgi:glycosyltransferase involved in cell wall biosynthesis
VVEGLRARNHELQLIRPGQHRGELAGSEEGFHEVLMRGLPIPRYPQLRMGVPSKKALLALWARRRPDVVHVATEGPMGWSAVQAARQLKLPLCSDFRTNFHAYSKHYGVGWLHKPIMAYLRKFHNLTSCTMTPDQTLRNSLTSYGFRNVAVVSRGVDTRLFHPLRRDDALRRSWGAGPDDLVVLHVGRLAPEKNLGALILAFEAIQRVQPRARLVLVGDGPSAKDIRARLPLAQFAGMRHGEELSAHYASGDLFLFPSLSETYGNVTPEAMASGLPVLAFDYAAAGQLVRPGLSGMLAPVDNTPEFVRFAVDLALDQPALHEMGRQARLTAEGQGWDRIIAHIETIYGALIMGAAVPQLHRAEPAAASVRAQGA